MTAFVPAAGRTLLLAREAPQSSSCRPQPAMTAASEAGATRRAVLAAALLPLAASLLPRGARAALLTRTQAGAEALAARDALGALALLVAEQRFDEMRRALRAGALSRVRASCRALADGSVAGDEGAYKKLLKGVEDVDGMALKASRGDKAAGEKVLAKYDELVEDFDEFLDLMPGLAVKPTLAK